MGSNQQLFHVDKDLLSLHSGLFRNELADLDEKGEERKQLSLPGVDPALFMDFVCWIRNGNLMVLQGEDLGDDSPVQIEDSWILGHILEAPGFQNFMIWDQLQGHWELDEYSEPEIENVRFVYKASERDSKLRRFYADFVACRNPFEKYGREDPEYQQWCDLFKEYPDLGLDVAKGSWQNDKLPWDHARIGNYMEEEPDLDQVWEEMILKARPVAEIEKGARKGCIRSRLELFHIKRNEVVDE